MVEERTIDGEAVGVSTCTRCAGQPEGMCSRCEGDGVDPDSPDCACDCCAGTGRCDMCFEPWVNV